MALLKDLTVFGASRFVSDAFGDNIYANKHIKYGSSDNYVLLGGGGHKAISDFSTSSHNHDDKYVTSLGTNGDYLTWTKNGSTNNITIPYATNSTYLKMISNSTDNYQDSAKTSSGNMFAVYALTGTALKASTGDGYVMSFNYGNQYTTQIAVDLDPTYKLAIRNWKKNNSPEWNDWKNILTGNNSYVSSGYGYIDSTEITKVQAADKFTSNATVTLTGDTTGTSAGSTKSWTVPTITKYITGLGRRSTVAAIKLNPSVDTGLRMTWHISDSSSRTNDATNSPSFDAGIINVPWDWGGYNGQIAIQNTVKGNTRMQIRSSTSIDNGEGNSPRYSSDYGEWREVVTATKATQIGSSTKPIYISNTGQVIACTYSLSANINSGTVNTIAYYSGANAISSYTSTVGGTAKPIYLNAGVPTALSATVGSSATDAIQLIYLSAGTLTAAAHNAGGTAKPVYVASGVIKPISATVGTSTKPIYLSSGTITVCSYELKSTVNGGIINRLAWYSSANTISSTGTISFLNNIKKTINSTDVYQNGLRIWGATYGNTDANLTANVSTNKYMSYGDPGPQIQFSTSEAGSQDGALIFTDHDVLGAGVSWHFVSNQSDWNVTSKRFVARTSITIGSNLPNTSYNFYVNGTSYFNGNVTHNGIIYLANGTTYWIDNSAIGYLNDLRVDQMRLVDNWIGWYSANNIGGNRYGYIQANGDRMYFRKENGVSSYAFDFGGGHIYTNGNYIFAGYLNTAISDENPTIGSVYVRNTSDNYIRRMSVANFINGLNAYWANIKVSSTSNSNTQPNFADIRLQKHGINFNSTNTIYQDGIDGSTNMPLFAYNTLFDGLYDTISYVEYYDGSNWVAWQQSSSYDFMKPAFNGLRRGNKVTIDHTHRRFRVITGSGSWCGSGYLCFGLSWWDHGTMETTTSGGNTVKVPIKVSLDYASTNSSSATFTNIFSNITTTEGPEGYYVIPCTIHNGKPAIRLTIEIPSWANTGNSTSLHDVVFGSWFGGESYQNKQINNLYWANVQVSATSNSATVPTFSWATFSRVSDHGVRAGTFRGLAVGSQTGEYIHMYERVHIGSPSGWGSRNAPSYGLSTYGGAWLATDTGSVGIGTISPETKLDVNGIQQIYQRGNDNTAFKDLLLLKQQNSSEASGDSWSVSNPTFGIGFKRYWTSSGNPYGETTCAGIYATVSSSWRGGLVFRTKNNQTQGGTHDVNALRLAPSGYAYFVNSIQSDQHIYSYGFHHRSKDDNNYVLLAGGGYESLSNIYKNMYSGISYEVDISLQIGIEWIDTGIDGSNTNLSTGAYIVSVFSNNYGVGGGNYSETYVGLMSWYNGGTNSTDSEEILLHNSGHAPNDKHIYLRTLRRTNTAGGLLLQIACDNNTTGNSTYKFKFKKLI